MSIKVKSTAVAIATVSSIFSYSVPSQAGEYGYLYELEEMARHHDVKSYLGGLSVSEKLELGKEYCKILENKSIKDIRIYIQKMGHYFLQKGVPEQKFNDLITLAFVGFDASSKELCPEYKYKFNNFLSESSED
jgi:hypothetical protein